MLVVRTRAPRRFEPTVLLLISARKNADQSFFLSSKSVTMLFHEKHLVDIKRKPREGFAAGLGFDKLGS